MVCVGALCGVREGGCLALLCPGGGEACQLVGCAGEAFQAWVAAGRAGQARRRGPALCARFGPPRQCACCKPPLVPPIALPCKPLPARRRPPPLLQVYLASASPPVRYPNVYGVDMPTRRCDLPPAVERALNF